MSDTEVREIEPRVIGLGHNRPPLRDLLRDQYEQIGTRVDALIASAGRAPATVNDDDTLGKMGDLIKSITACGKQIEAARVSEKEPFLAAGREVDGFFKPMGDTLAVAKKRLEAPCGVYLRAKADAEKKAREAIEAAARRAAEDAMRQAQEAEAANLTAVSDAALDRALTAEADADRAQKAAEAKPAELARTRGEMGSVATLRTSWDAEILDYAAIPLEAIRAFVPRDAIEKAVRAFVRAGGRELKGVRIYENSTAVVR